MEESLAASALLPAVLARFPRRAANVLAIFGDDLAHVLRVHSGLWSDVGDGAAEADIIANDVDAVRFFEKIVDVRLPHAEVSVEIASIVWFVTISHLCSFGSSEWSMKCRARAMGHRPRGEGRDYSLDQSRSVPHVLARNGAGSPAGPA